MRYKVYIRKVYIRKGFEDCSLYKIVNNYNTQLKRFISFKAESDPGLAGST